MPWSYTHINWLVPTGKQLQTANGKSVDVYEFVYDEADSTVMSAWAKHFRNHYCLDTEIDRIKPKHLSRAEYLAKFKFPDGVRPGPSVQSGDFSEILVSDFLHFVLGYWVPRTRYGTKTVRNESTKGSDVMGFKIVKDGAISDDDTLMIVESKAQFSGRKANARLQSAINDSVKDSIRIGESLNAIRQRLFDKNNFDDADKISRFQNPTDIPYVEEYGAAALFNSNVYDEAKIQESDSSKHPSRDKLTLVVIHGADMMKLVKKLYQIARDEADNP